MVFRRRISAICSTRKRKSWMRRSWPRPFSRRKRSRSSANGDSTDWKKGEIDEHLGVFEHNGDIFWRVNLSGVSMSCEHPPFALDDLPTSISIEFGDFPRLIFVFSDIPLWLNGEPWNRPSSKVPDLISLNWGIFFGSTMNKIALSVYESGNMIEQKWCWLPRSTEITYIGKSYWIITGSQAASAGALGIDPAKIRGNLAQLWVNAIISHPESERILQKWMVWTIPKWRFMALGLAKQGILRGHPIV